MAWDQVGPLAGVVVGGVLARSLSRDAFIRDQSIAEVTRRREHFATYQKKLWAYAARVKVARDLVAAARQGSQTTAQPGPAAAPPYNMALTRQRQEDCRDAIADLRMFASSETQEAAWAAMEALSESFNLLVAGDQAASDRAFQGYEESFARFATALNRELEEINHMLYAYQTRLWRAVLNRVRGEPLPFQISTSADPGTALSGPGEERIPIQ